MKSFVAGSGTAGPPRHISFVVVVMGLRSIERPVSSGKA